MVRGKNSQIEISQNSAQTNEAYMLVTGWSIQEKVLRVRLRGVIQHTCTYVRLECRGLVLLKSW